VLPGFALWALVWFLVAWFLVAALASHPPHGAMYVFYAFLFLWFIGWTVGGIRAALALYRLLRPSVAETLHLAAHGVMYDSGIRPPQGDDAGHASLKEAWKAALPKRVRVEIDRRALQSMRLRETDDGNRLTVDVDGQRLDIGKSASEIEREWLYRLLAKRYALTLAERR
jgi:hypothetical protein